MSEQRTFSRKEDAQADCKDDIYCSFVWSPNCSDNMWMTCNIQTPTASAGDVSSCTSLKAEVPKVVLALSAEGEKHKETQNGDAVRETSANEDSSSEVAGDKAEHAETES